MNTSIKAGIMTGLVGIVAAPSAMALDGVVTVSPPTELNGWVDASINGGTATLVDDAPAGMGSNSLQLKTTSDVAAKAVFAHPENMPLNDVTTLSYLTKQVAASSEGGSASMTLAVDLTGDGTFDTNLVFEPYWQNEGSPDPAPVSATEWQQWDVDQGMFWSSKSYGEGDAALVAGSGGAPFYTLEQIKAWYPNAQLQGIGVNVGSYNTDYAINVDGVQLNGQTYNFEAPLVDDGDGEEEAPVVPLTKDECKKGGWKTLQNVDGRMFRNQGQCVSFAAKIQNMTSVDVNNS